MMMMIPGSWRLMHPDAGQVTRDLANAAFSHPLFLLLERGRLSPVLGRGEDLGVGLSSRTSLLLKEVDFSESLLKEVRRGEVAPNPGGVSLAAALTIFLLSVGLSLDPAADNQDPGARLFGVRLTFATCTRKEDVFLITDSKGGSTSTVANPGHIHRIPCVPSEAHIGRDPERRTETHTERPIHGTGAPKRQRSRENDMDLRGPTHMGRRHGFQPSQYDCVDR